MLGEGAGVNHLASDVLGGKRLEFVRGDDQVREGVEGERAVVVPVHRADVQGQGAHVGLAGDCLGEVGADVP